MNCNCCFTDTLAKCETEIVVNAILPEDGTYRWVITDKFGNKYEGDFEYNIADGSFSIPVEDLPAGMLTQYSGEFNLQVFPTDATCGAIKMLVAGSYDCITFNITGGTFVKDNLGCPIPSLQP